MESTIVFLVFRVNKLLLERNITIKITKKRAIGFNGELEHELL